MRSVTYAAAAASVAVAIQPPTCDKSTPAPTDPKNCSLKAPTDPEFPSVCHPGAMGHAGGAEYPVNRCDSVKDTKGAFRCACCGAPLFYASAMFRPPPAGDGWPAWHGNASVVGTKGTNNVCTPGGTEVVCATCGSHLGDHFNAGSIASYEYFCIDGVCLLPPGAADGQVCKPETSQDSQQAASSTSSRLIMRQLQTAASEQLQSGKPKIPVVV